MKVSNLATHNIRILFWVNFFGTMSFINPVIQLFYTGRGLEPQDIMFIIMFWSGAVLIGEIPTGMFADRFGAKPSFLVGSLVKLLSIIILINAVDLWHFFLASALSGFAVTFFSGAGEALLYESLKQSNREDEMDQAMGKIQSATFITMMGTVLIGAYFAQDLKESQFQFLLYASLICQAIEFFFLLFIKEPPNKVEKFENPISQIAEGAKVIKHNPELLMMFMNVSIVFIPSAAIFDNFEQLLLFGAGLPVKWLGVILAISALFGLAASRSIGLLTKIFSPKGLMVGTGLTASGCLFLVSVWTENLLLVLGVLFILRFIRAIRYPVYSKISNEYIPSYVRATTISILSVLDSVFDLIIMGTVAYIAVLGLPKIYLLCSIIVLIGTFIPIRRAKEKHLSKHVNLNI